MKLSGPLLKKVDRNSDLYKKLATAHPKIAQKDPTLWGTKASHEAAIRLNWVDLPTSSLTLLPDVSLLCEMFKGCSRVVLCGMGGSSLGPEVIAQSNHRELFIFDSTDPHYAVHAIGDDLKSTLVIVSSKSGSTIETSSQRSLFEGKFHESGLNPTEHILFVTDQAPP